MRVSKERAAENRERVVAVAGRLLRQHGFDGIGVDGLMQAAGLTHGSFYRNFASKEALVAEACERLMDDNVTKWPTGPQRPADETFRRFVQAYLSDEHCRALGDGCVFAALATDAGRREASLRRVFARGLAASVERMAGLFPGRPAKRRKRALATIAGLVGAVVLARAIDDETARKELLSATATMVLQLDAAHL